MKRALSVILALIMIFGSSLTVLAADETSGASDVVIITNPDEESIDEEENAGEEVTEDVADEDSLEESIEDGSNDIDIIESVPEVVDEEIDEEDSEENNVSEEIKATVGIQPFAISEYNVTTYGANGSDKNDDTAAIQAALNVNRHVAVNDTSRAIVVYVPAGTYYINSNLSIFSNTTLRLHANATIVRTNPSAQMLLGRGANYNDANIGNYSKIKNITIEGGTWDGNANSGSDYMGLMLLRHGTNIKIRNTTIKNCVEHHVNVSASKEVLIEGVTFRDGLKYTGSDSGFLGGSTAQNRYSHIEALHLDSATQAGEPNLTPQDGNPCKDVIVRNCTFDKVFAGVGNHHITAKKTSNVIIENNTFKNVFFAGVLGFGFTDLVVKNNVANNVNTLIDAYTSTGSITNNTVTGNFSNFLSGITPRDTSRIQIYDGSNFTIADNRLSGGARSGVEVGTGAGKTQGSTAVIRKNDISSTGTRGVHIADNSNNVQVIDNVISNAKERGIFVIKANNITIERNKVTGSGSDGIFLETGNNIKVSNNTFSNNKNRGIAIEHQTKNATITNNITANNAGSWDIAAYNKSTGRIQTNFVDDKRIYLQAGTSFTKSGNTKDTTFTVRYNANGGTGSMAETTVTYGKTTKLRANAYRLSGRVFRGWNAHRQSDNKWIYVSGSKDGWYLKGQQPAGYTLKVYSNQAGVAKTSSTNKDIVTMHAVWEQQTFTIQYNANGGTGSMSASTIIFGVSQQLRANNFSKTGSRFGGWNAHRKSDNKWLYTNGSKDAWYLKNKQASGYRLKVYSNKASVAKTSGTNRDVVTMHAVWNTNKYTIQYNINGGTSGSMANTVVTYGVSTKIRANAFKRTGYLFGGWNAHRRSDNKWLYVSGSKEGWYLKDKQPAGYRLKVYKNQVSVAKTSSSNNDLVTMYAVWEQQTFTIQYNANGGTGSMSASTIIFGVNQALRANTFSKTGSHFGGWNAHRRSDNKWLYTNGSKDTWYLRNKQASGYRLKVYANRTSVARTSGTNKDVVTMQAVWNANKYTIQYNINGGTSGSMANTVVTYGVSTKIRANAFKRTGYQFGGWHAHRRSDNKWLYVSGSKEGWYLKDQQPAGYRLKVYNNQVSVAKTTSRDKDIVTMYAIWR